MQSAFFLGYLYLIAQEKFICEDCGKLFTAKRNLQRHHQCNCPFKRIDMPRYNCSFCTFTTNRTDNYNNHIRQHHGLSGHHLVGKRRVSKTKTGKLNKKDTFSVQNDDDKYFSLY